jgi:hypothetical protein
MLQFDPSTGLLSLPIWVSATTAAVLVVLAILALARSGTFKTLFALFALGVVVYGGWMGWLMFERLSDNERIEERRVFDRRVAELVGRASAPGSALSCLEGAANELVANGCEKVLFGSPENVAAAASYVSARIALLADGLDTAARSDVNFDSALNVLRRGLEADRFGVVAYVMAQQPDCLPQQCEMLTMLRDANRVRVNLQDKPFEALVAKYSPQWTQISRANSAPEPGRSASGTTPAAPVSSRYDLPSAASIPPVSIMNTEPGQTAAPAAATAPAASPVARRPPAVRAPVARTAAPAEPAPPPVPLAPAAANAPATAPNAAAR